MLLLPAGYGIFEFAVLSGLRAAQLMRGCAPLLITSHKHTVTAQLEVAAGKIVGVSAGSGVLGGSPHDRRPVTVETREKPTARRARQVAAA